MGVSFSMQVSSTDGQFAAPPEPANGPDLSSETSMLLSPISPDRRQRFRYLLESANGPDLSSEASIGIAWTTNKLNPLRFDSTSLRVHLQAAIKSYLAAHRCVRPTISAPPVTARCGTESVGATTMRYAVEASNFLCICPHPYYGVRPSALPKRPRSGGDFMLSFVFSL